jgi:hypothetical protein
MTEFAGVEELGWRWRIHTREENSTILTHFPPLLTTFRTRGQYNIRLFLHPVVVVNEPRKALAGRRDLRRESAPLSGRGAYAPASASESVAVFAALPQRKLLRQVD